jgi:hypothetical protein
MIGAVEYGSVLFISPVVMILSVRLLVGPFYKKRRKKLLKRTGGQAKD